MSARIVALTTLAALALAPPADAQLRGEWMADNLRTGCQPMGLDAYTWAGDEDLEDRLRIAAEFRLRAARLLAKPSRDPMQWLVVSAGVGGPEDLPPDVSARAIMLMRWTENTGYGLAGPVIVCAHHGLGDIDGTASQVSEMVDRFLVEYLRANEEACAKVSQP